MNMNYIKNLEEERLLKAKLLLNKINHKQDLINKKNEQIENLNYEKDLITEDIVHTIKNSLQDSEFNLIWGASSVYRDAWRYGYNKDYPDANIFKDDETKDKAKKAYKWVTDSIKEKILLNNKKFKLKSISVYGYDNQGYSFYYTYGKQAFEIYIPMFNTTNKDNYKEMLLGYRILIKTSDNCWKCILYNIDYHQLANNFKEYLEKLEV